MTGMARVGVLLPMGEWHTQQEGEADTTRWDRCRRRDVDGRNHADCYPKGTPAPADQWHASQQAARPSRWICLRIQLYGGYGTQVIHRGKTPSVAPQHLDIQCQSPPCFVLPQAHNICICHVSLVHKDTHPLLPFGTARWRVEKSHIPFLLQPSQGLPPPSFRLLTQVQVLNTHNIKTKTICVLPQGHPEGAPRVSDDFSTTEAAAAVKRQLITKVVLKLSDDINNFAKIASQVSRDNSNRARLT